MELLKYIAETFSSGWRPWVEVALIAALLYLAFRFLRGPRGAGLLRGMFFIFVIALSLAYVGARAAGLERAGWALERASILLAVGVLVVFHPEIRKALARLGRRPIFNVLLRPSFDVLDEVAKAAEVLSKRGRGALLAIERMGDLGAFARGGTRLEAYVSSDLLVSLFSPEGPLRDGAVIIRGGRVAAAGCLLPLSDSHELSRSLGARHRAGVGLTERTDAVTVIVSGQSGKISLGVRGDLMQGLTAGDLRATLRKLCGGTEDMRSESLSEQGT